MVGQQGHQRLLVARKVIEGKWFKDSYNYKRLSKFESKLAKLLSVFTLFFFKKGTGLQTRALDCFFFFFTI